MSATASAIPNYEQAGELKIGQVGIANLRVRTLDVDALAQEMRERVSRAPKLFARAAVVVDFGGLAQTPDVATARALVDALRDAGVIPVALAYGTTANEQLAVELGLPLLRRKALHLLREVLRDQLPQKLRRGREVLPADRGGERAFLHRAGLHGVARSRDERGGVRVHLDQPPQG